MRKELKINSKNLFIRYSKSPTPPDQKTPISPNPKFKIFDIRKNEMKTVDTSNRHLFKKFLKTNNLDAIRKLKGIEEPANEEKELGNSVGQTTFDKHVKHRKRASMFQFPTSQFTNTIMSKDRPSSMRRIVLEKIE